MNHERNAKLVQLLEEFDAIQKEFMRLGALELKSPIAAAMQDRLDHLEDKIVNTFIDGQQAPSLTN